MLFHQQLKFIADRQPSLEPGFGGCGCLDGVGKGLGHMWDIGGAYVAATKGESQQYVDPNKFFLRHSVEIWQY